MRLPDRHDRVLLLHNPRCSKSRAVRELLAARGVPFEERRYLEQPLSRAELVELARRLDRPPQQWIRRGEEAYAAAALGPAPDTEALFDAIAAHPVLMERPIVVRGERAVVGRPPERVAQLLDGAEPER